MKSLNTFILMMGLLTAVSITAVSCSENKDGKHVDGNIMELVVEADQLKSGIARGYLLQSSSEKDKSGIETLLNKIQTALLALSKDPSDQAVYQNLRIYLAELDQFQVLSEDSPQFKSFVEKTYSIAYQYSQNNGIDLLGMGWMLYSYNFSAGTQPFYSYPENKWEARWTLDDSSVQFADRDAAAVFLSPSFDLSEVETPSFRFSHLMLANKNNGSDEEFDRRKYLTEAFTVYVSNTYVAGEDPFLTEDGRSLGVGSKLNHPENKWKWTKVDLGEYPNGAEFATVQTPLIDLAPFKGENVTIAFYFNNKGLGFHYTTWQIDRFELLGVQTSGASLDYKTPPQSLAGVVVENGSMAPFQSVTPAEGGAKWEPGSGGGNVYISARSWKDAPSDTWLLSPIYKLRNQTNLKLLVGEIVNEPVWSNFQIKISTNYKGGDPRQATWDVVPRPQTNPTGSGWLDNTEEVDLTPYMGKDVVFAFHYIDEGGPGFRVWEIVWYSIKGDGELIETEDYEASLSSGVLR